MHSHFRRLNVESLEERTVLSVNVAIVDDTIIVTDESASNNDLLIYGASNNRLKIKSEGQLVELIDLNQFGEGFNLDVQLGVGSDKLVIKGLTSGLRELAVDTGAEVGLFPFAGRHDNDSVTILRVNADSISIDTGLVVDWTTNDLDGSIDQLEPGIQRIIFPWPLPFQDTDQVSLSRVTTSNGGLDIRTGGTLPEFGATIPGPGPIPKPIIVESQVFNSDKVQHLAPAQQSPDGTPDIYPLPIRPWFFPGHSLADADRIYIASSNFNGGDVNIETGADVHLGVAHFPHFPPIATDTALTTFPQIEPPLKIVPPGDSDRVVLRNSNVTGGDIIVDTGLRADVSSTEPWITNSLTIHPHFPVFATATIDNDFVRVQDFVLAGASGAGGNLHVSTGAEFSGVGSSYQFFGLKSQDSDRIRIRQVELDNSLKIDTGINVEGVDGDHRFRDKDNVMLQVVKQTNPDASAAVLLGDDTDILTVRDSEFAGDALFNGGDGKDRAINIDNVFALVTFLEFEDL